MYRDIAQNPLLDPRVKKNPQLLKNIVPAECTVASKRRRGFGLDDTMPSKVPCVHSHEVNMRVQIKLERLVGCDRESCKDAYAKCELYCWGELLCPPTISPQCTTKENNVWLTFPITYKDLPLDTLCCVTIYSVQLPAPHVFGATCFYLFTAKGKLKRGTRKFIVHPGVEADTSYRPTTLGKIRKLDSLTVITKCAQEYSLHPTLHIPWLDKLTFTEINKLNTEAFNHGNSVYIVVEFPVFFDYTILYSKSQAEARALDNKHPEPKFEHNQAAPASSVTFLNDPEIEKENPAEEKNMRLAKTYHLFVDPDLLPSPAERRRIYDCAALPPTRTIERQDQILLWQFRYFLTDVKNAFPKFARIVDWKNPKEKEEARKCIENWDKSKISTEDALELLSFSFAKNNDLRAFAVGVLEKLKDEELVAILLQLVQALRYDEDPTTSPLCNLLLNRASQSFEMASYLHWYLQVETEDHKMGDTFKGIHQKLFSRLQQDLYTAGFVVQIKRQENLVNTLKDIYKTLKEGSKDARQKKIQKLRQMLKDSNELASCFDPPSVSDSFAGGVDGIVSVDASGATQSMNPTAHAGGEVFGCENKGAVRLPLMPQLEIVGVKCENAHLFASAMMPMLVTFNIGNKGVQEFKCIVKNGDDMRQDQLVLQFLNLMDGLLSSNGFKMKLTPYRVLATSANSGLMQCVPDCVAMSAVGKDVQKHLRKHNPDELAPYGIKAEAMDNYIKSCAGYCVITYVLGIGDRHLDNLMITNDGRLFHIDFGFILGNDPKPFPPAMKMTKEMVEGMGGADSPDYHEFKKKACSTYNVLRKHSSLLLNLLVLMIDANIPDIEGKDAKVKGTDPMLNLQKVEEKLRLDLNDADAVTHFQTMLNVSVAALFPRLMENVHKAAQFFR